MKTFIILAAVAAFLLLLAAPQLAQLFGPTDNAVEIERARAMIEAMRTTRSATDGLAVAAFMNSLVVVILALALLVMVATVGVLLVKHWRPPARPQPQLPPAQMAPQFKVSRPSQAALPPGQAAGGRWEWVPGVPVQAPQPQVFYLVQPGDQGDDLPW